MCFPVGFWRGSLAIRYASHHFQNRSVPAPLRYKNGNRWPIRYENWNRAIAIWCNGKEHKTLIEEVIKLDYVKEKFIFNHIQHKNSVF